MICPGVPLQPLRSLLAPGRRQLHRDITQRGEEIRQPCLAEVQNMPCEPPHARPRFHQQKLFRPFELLPHLGKFARKLPAKNRSEERRVAKEWRNRRAASEYK